MANYANDNIFSSAKKELMNVLNNLENDSDILLKWLKKQNFLKANPDKYILLFSINGKKILRVRWFSLTNIKFEKLLGIKIES